MPKLKACATPALIFLLLIAAAQPASAVDWVEITEDIDGWIWFFDRDSIQDKSDSTVVWVKRLLPDGSCTMDLFEFDFSNRTLKTLVQHWYNSDGRLQSSDTTPGEWEHIVPETYGETVYLALKRWLKR